MFSLTTKNYKGARPIAIIENTGEIIYIIENDYTDEQIPWIETTGKNKFFLYPGPDYRCLLAGGPSGVGKSSFFAKYIKLYKQIYHKGHLLVISRLNEDPVIDKLKPTRIALDDDFLENPPELEDVEDGDIVLFDDCDQIHDKPLQKAVYKFKDQLMEMGRGRLQGALGVNVLITNHLINSNDKQTGRVNMSECKGVIFYPGSNAHGIKLYLKEYGGIESAPIINFLQRLPSRWVCVTQFHPQLIISEHLICFVNDLEVYIKRKTRKRR